MRYFILGATQARDERGLAVPLGGARLRALLAALALRPGRTVPVADLVADVWADDPPQDSPAALQALVGRLRRALGRDAVVSAPGGYRLAAGREDVDLYGFERLADEGAAQLAAGDAEGAARTLREALGLWRGPALADLPDRSGGDHGVRPEARRFAALRQRIEADLRRGSADSALAELTALTAEHPYDEPLHAQLIRALRDAGRRADALAAYERLRRTLADDLGTDPGPEPAALHAALLAEPPPSRAPAPDADPQGQARGNIRPRLTSFVGRERDIADLRADLARSRLVTLTGPGGSGKTRLAEEAAPPGAWLVELAPLDDPSAVPGAVLSALGLRETQLAAREDRAPVRRDATARLVEHLGRRRMLLVLDNCEHVVGAAAELAEVL
ncbi:BTAD domain-containing putative transcriptional regulator, partial [Streptomyces sp. NPDC047002]|uniref:AfsR/SARP family transcriptional regulator n=1 Tax=Streptomyces sp. NPDC047002 TaxID=3155475 RepID=UPI0034535479